MRTWLSPYVTAEGNGTGQQKRVADWSHQYKDSEQPQQYQSRQKEGYAVVADWVLMMGMVSVHHDPNRSVNHPAVKEILKKAENKQAHQKG